MPSTPPANRSSRHDSPATVTAADVERIWRALSQMPTAISQLATATTAQTRMTAQLVEHLAAASPAAAGMGGAMGLPGQSGELSIHSFEPDAYAAEVEAMTVWVDEIVLGAFGAEVTATRPWCTRWPDHPDAVGMLHMLWLGWQQLTAGDAGLLGPVTWLRDVFFPVMDRLRAPDGPFAACTTDPSRPTHRVLAPPQETEHDSLPVAPPMPQAPRAARLGETA
ncbi:DUF4913 domain-containing protein [Streptacidiphilus jiangxiensis]|uniref:DUF4913 domain-containing protein n=1 Tax=Streptacidiphilus jiangxiensis TaxID=235985 RepID=A0A1H7GY31_STRJI|nr:DUF4913 domain-containing protein [Streptacidiphilus jiangxiensis]SEK43066.1 protein of unknown function [Streptacidiphilus jiangxiensis]